MYEQIVELFDKTKKEIFAGEREYSSFEEVNDHFLQELQSKFLELSPKLSLDSFKEKVCSYINEKAEHLASQFVNIVQFGDYAKDILESEESKTAFLKSECSNPKNWNMKYVQQKKVGQIEIVSFAFHCKAADDGDSLMGFVYLDKNLDVKRAFANVSE